MIIEITTILFWALCAILFIMAYKWCSTISDKTIKEIKEERKPIQQEIEEDDLSIEIGEAVSKYYQRQSGKALDAYAAMLKGLSKGKNGSVYSVAYDKLLERTLSDCATDARRQSRLDAILTPEQINQQWGIDGK